MNDRKIPAAALALLVHLMLLAVLVFGFRWQASEPVTLEAQIWHDLPPVEQSRRAPKPVHEPKPVPQVAPKPEPEPAPQPQVQDPDIALKKAREAQQREAQLEREKLEQEKLEKEKFNQEKLLAQQKELEKQKQLKMIKEQKLRVQKLEAAKVRAAQQKAKEQADALMKKMQAREASARASLIGQYTAKIKSKIRRYVVVPPDMQGNPEAVFEVVLLPDGEVMSATLRKSSGNAAYDAAVERAILRASPLPLPADPTLFGNFRDLDLHFRPNE